jgi:hypothetical protein
VNELRVKPKIIFIEWDIERFGRSIQNLTSTHVKTITSRPFPTEENLRCQFHDQGTGSLGPSAKGIWPPSSVSGIFQRASPMYLSLFHQQLSDVIEDFIHSNSPSNCNRRKPWPGVARVPSITNFTIMIRRIKIQ